MYFLRPELPEELAAAERKEEVRNWNFVFGGCQRIVLAGPQSQVVGERVEFEASSQRMWLS